MFEWETDIIKLLMDRGALHYACATDHTEQIGLHATSLCILLWGNRIDKNINSSIKNIRKIEQKEVENQKEWDKKNVLDA